MVTLPNSKMRKGKRQEWRKNNMKIFISMTPFLRTQRSLESQEKEKTFI